MYFNALCQRDADFEGIFYVGVKTTGVFCRPTCPARKPKFENCEFFAKAEQALLAAYRPCQRCQPLTPPGAASAIVKKLIQAVEANPEKRWKDADFRAIGCDASTARRQFNKRFGMTFVAYARARRMGLAMKSIRDGEKLIDTQLASGYESASGFRDAFAKIMGDVPSRLDDASVLKARWLDTELGPMIAIADDHELYLLEFIDRRGLEREVEKLRKMTKSAIVPGDCAPLESIEHELESYFAGELNEFTTPIASFGSDFQRQVWAELRKIPSGETRSYAELAKAIGRPTASRAVARANGTNQIAIVIPCHRIINSNGELGGYGGGLARKQWLINHEHATHFSLRSE